MNCRDKRQQQRDSAALWSPLDYAYDFLAFMNSNPSEFHATAAIRAILDRHGFKYLSERDDWAGTGDGLAGKFYTVRNGSSVAAFVVEAGWRPEDGVGVVGTHLDALTVKLKPVSLVETSGENGGYLRLGVAPYSGALSPVWWDRDLGLAGRLIVRDGAQRIKPVLVKLDHPIGRIPTLAPHFGAAADGPFNKETNMVPIIGLQDEDTPEPSEAERRSPVVGSHDIRVLRAVARAAGVELGDILEVELQLYDFHSGVLGGLDREFLICGRLDDKLCTYAALHGLLESRPSKGGDAPPQLNMVAFFDNEEIGSLTRQGARGGLIEHVIDRLLLRGEASLKRQLWANSFFVSADNTHAVNPNFAGEYLDLHKPRLNVGMTVKHNVDMANTTDAVSSALVREVCRRSGNQVQVFHIRNDSRSGGTIGPAVSAALGMRAIDVGIPQLAMHSIRATTGTRDVYLGVKFFKGFFEHWKTVDRELERGGL